MNFESSRLDWYIRVSSHDITAASTKTRHRNCRSIILAFTRDEEKLIWYYICARCLIRVYIIPCTVVHLLTSPTVCVMRSCSTYKRDKRAQPKAAMIMMIMTMSAPSRGRCDCNHRGGTFNAHTRFSVVCTIYNILFMNNFAVQF